jgi:ParB family chromosome partitioning protein
MATAVEVNSEYRNPPLAQLQESTTNPRRRFDAHSLEELAASFKVQGVLQPLLVRTIEDDKYEVIAGARRLRAAKLAALEEVPARIAELSDIEGEYGELSEFPSDEEIDKALRGVEFATCVDEFVENASVQELYLGYSLAELQLLAIEYCSGHLH